MDSGRFSYIQIYAFVLCLQFTLSSITFASANSKWSYMLVTMVSQLSYGAPFVMLPVHINEVCSDQPEYGVKLYAIVFSFAGATTFFMSQTIYILTKHDLSIYDDQTNGAYA